VTSLSTSIPALPPRSTRAGRAKTSPVRDLLALTERPEVISFAGGLPAPELFDLEGIRAAYEAALVSPAVLQYSTSEGNVRLREIVAQRYTDDGLPTTASDLLVTTGSQQVSDCWPPPCSTPATSCSSRSRAISPPCRRSSSPAPE